MSKSELLNLLGEQARKQARKQAAEKQKIFLNLVAQAMSLGTKSTDVSVMNVEGLTMTQINAGNACGKQAVVKGGINFIGHIIET